VISNIYTVLEELKTGEYRKTANDIVWFYKKIFKLNKNRLNLYGFQFKSNFQHFIGTKNRYLFWIKSYEKTHKIKSSPKKKLASKIILHFQQTVKNPK
jgi:hypothetical protein